MPIITGPLFGRRALVDVEVSVPPPRGQSIRRAGLAPVGPFLGKGLLDSGADLTCIDPMVRQTLALTPFNRIPILHPGSGPNPAPSFVYKVDLTILHPSGHAPFNLVRKLLTVVELDLAHMGAYVLVGCDVLEKCMFIYHGQAGNFSLTY
jgi:hypothetical protein